MSYRTNRIIGGVAPSEYLGKLEKGTAQAPPIEGHKLDGYVASHLVDSRLLRADDFDAFMEDRQKRLLALVEAAMGKSAYAGTAPEEGEDVEAEDGAAEASFTVGEKDVDQLPLA